MLRSTVVVEESPRTEHTLRERAVGKLKKIESDLRSANDVQAAEVVQRAIKELQGGLNLRERSKSLGRFAGDGLLQSAAAARSSFRAVREAAGPAARSAAGRAAERAIVAKDVALDKGSNLVRSTASGVTGGYARAHKTLSDFSGHLDIKELPCDLNLRERSETLKRTAGEGLRQTATTVGSSFQKASEAVGPTVRSGAVRVAEGAIAVKDIALDQGGDVVRLSAAGMTAGIAIAYKALTGFSGNLDWSSIDPTKYLQAGTRGVSRGLEEARLVWESLPDHLRALGPEEISKRLDGFDWSHIRPFSEGGSNDASNGIFELAGLNRSRGASYMTAAEVQAAEQVLADQAFKAALYETASQAFTGAVAGAAVGCVIASLEHGLEYQRGEITQNEMFRHIGSQVAASAAVGAAVSGLMTVIALAFPALIPVAVALMIPLALLGFCALGGKVVRLGKGWYELSRTAYARRSPGVFRSRLCRHRKRWQRDRLQRVCIPPKSLKDGWMSNRFAARSDRGATESRLEGPSGSAIAQLERINQFKRFL